MRINLKTFIPVHQFLYSLFTLHGLGQNLDRFRAGDGLVRLKKVGLDVLEHAIILGVRNRAGRPVPDRHIEERAFCDRSNESGSACQSVISNGKGYGFSFGNRIVRTERAVQISADQLFVIRNFDIPRCPVGTREILENLVPGGNARKRRPFVPDNDRGKFRATAD